MTEAPAGPSGGLFLVVEGIEGAGKTTQVSLLSRWMEASGIPHVATREPGGTAVGEALRSLVLNRTDLDLPPESELLVILAARAAFVRDVVRPALARGDVVVSDRYDLSTFAYQGWGRGLDIQAVRRLSAFATGGLSPHLYVLLDVEVRDGAARQRLQGKGADRFEAAGEAFLTRVREGYLSLARSEPGVERVDATGTSDAVHQKVRSLLQARFPETFRQPGR
jgi:dTMP kinase